MASHLKSLRSVFNVRQISRPCQVTAHRSFVSLPVEIPTSIDEETLPHYDAKQCYPVHIGDLFNDRYRVTGKLGYGAYSTSWLCQDIQNQSYIVLKVSTSLQTLPSTTNREFKSYEHLAKINSAHPGQSLLRELYNSFELRGYTGNHRCLVLQPMHMTLLETMNLNPKPFDLLLLKMMVRRLLLALDYLHTEANITHTGTIFRKSREEIFECLSDLR
ncbi:protein kinase domain protein [Penicillium verhagenii]|uniref:protein kinase domain protein n=1 Tax=Penicillium verhagenii TaxID=1562060 RepID=UPI00254566FA|nr:protein kinase domain protein [Penicillium verhagenii]KAJ5934499.1 protein kinase domain protein [Penicillium verhagenii]